MVVRLKFKRSLSDVSTEERLAFGRRHALSHDELARFFDTLQSSLQPHMYAPPPSYNQRRRRQAVLGKIANDLRGAAKGSRRAAETMTDLMEATPPVRDSRGREQEHPLGPLLPDVEKVIVILNWLVQRAEEQRAQWIYPEPRDRRRTCEDRERVVRQLLSFWARCGRPLTFTTNDIAKTRSGPLIEFLQDALKLLTDPPTALHPETLAHTINAGRSWTLFNLKREAEYLELLAEGKDPLD